MRAEKFAVADQIVMIPIGRLLDNPLNHYLRGDSVTPESCESLAASIRENGVQTPLLVTPYRDAFRIVEGHRRRMASKLAGLTELPCVIKEGLDEAQQFNRMLAENIQRENLAPTAEARCYEKLESEGSDLAAIERRTGVPRQRVKNLLCVLRLEPEVQAYFDARKLPLGAAPLLTQIAERDSQIAFARRAAQAGWSVLTIADKVADWAPRARGAERKKRAPRTPLGRLVGEGGERVTKAEALALFDEGATFSLRDIKRAILGSCCDDCDEKRFPDICRECPLSQMLATLLDVKGARGPAAASAPTAQRAEVPPAEEEVRAA